MAQQAKRTLEEVAGETAQLGRGAATKVLYCGGGREEVEEHDYEAVHLFHCISNTLPDNPPQAWNYFEHFRTRCHPRIPRSLTHTVALLHQRIGLEPKFVHRYRIR